MWKFFHRIHPCETLDWYHGACWFDYSINHAVTCPIPFNLIVRWSRLFWLRMARPDIKGDAWAHAVNVSVENANHIKQIEIHIKHISDLKGEVDRLRAALDDGSGKITEFTSK